VAVPVMAVMMLMGRNGKIMGEFVLGGWLLTGGWLATGGDGRLRLRNGRDDHCRRIEWANEPSLNVDAPIHLLL
jgi:hypothetical protein